MRLLFVVAVIALSIACGKSEAEIQAEATAKAAEELAKAAEAAVKDGSAAAATDVAKAMQGMAAAFSNSGADGKPVEPVAFKTLQTQLPAMSGWDMRAPRGEQTTMPMPYSQSSARYRKGEANVDVKIMDTGMAPMFITPFTMMLASGYSRETDAGYEKATTVNGHPAEEKWDSRENRGELNILLGKRFMITVQGHHLSGIKDVHAFAAAMNFNAIAALK